MGAPVHLLLFVGSVVFALSSLSVWRGFRWNWQGKIFATASVIWICLFSGVVTLKDAGITTAWKKGWWIPFLVVFSIFGLMFWFSGKTGFPGMGKPFGFKPACQALTKNWPCEDSGWHCWSKRLSARASPSVGPGSGRGTIITLVFGFVHVFSSAILGPVVLELESDDDLVFWLPLLVGQVPVRIGLAGRDPAQPVQFGGDEPGLTKSNSRENRPFSIRASTLAG